MKRLLLLICLGLLIATSLSAEFTQTARMRTRMSLYNEIGVDMPSNSYVDSRMRWTLANEFDEDVKLVWQMEVGDIKWGTSPSTDIGTDGVNIETKHAYIDFQCPMMDGSMRVGLQGWADHRGLVFDDDFAALMLNRNFGEFKAQFGFAKVEEGNLDSDDDDDLFLLNLDSEKYGMHNIIRRSNGGKDLEMWFMPYYVYNMDALTIDAMFAYNYGSFEKGAINGEDLTNGGMALALKAKYDMGVKLALDFVYATGDDGEDAESTTIFNQISGYYMNGLEIFGNGAHDGVTEGGASVGNNGAGSMNIVLRGDYPLKENMCVYGAFGMINAIEGDETALAMEFDLGMKIKIKEPLSLTVVGAFAAPGDGLGDDLDSVHELSTVLQYKF